MNRVFGILGHPVAQSLSPRTRLLPLLLILALLPSALPASARDQKSISQLGTELAEKYKNHRPAR